MLATIQKSSGHELSIARFSVVAILVIATATSTTRTHQRHFLVAGFTPSIHSARFLTPKKHSISIVTSSNPLEDQQSWSRTVTANDPFLVKAHLSPTSAPSPHVSNKQPRNVRKERLHLVLKYLQALQSKRRWMKRRLVTCYMAMTIFLTTIFGAAGSATAAVGAGRMGGSFGPSSSSSRMTPSTSSYSRSYSQSGGKSHSYTRARPSAPSITVYSRPVLPFRRHHRPIYVSSDGPVATRFSTSDVLLLTGTGALIAYGFSNNFRNDRHNDGTRRHRQQPQSLLGPGSTVASITVNLNVPDRTNPNCILQKLRRLSQQADTSSRQGVQRMVSEGTTKKADTYLSICCIFWDEESLSINVSAEKRHHTYHSLSSSSFTSGFGTFARRT